jgi:serine/threonine protein kinase
MGYPAWPPLFSDLPAPLDGYRLEEELGQGGQGVVYLASRRDDPDSRWAIKFLRPGASDQHVQAFVAEAAYGIAVRSPYVGHTHAVHDLRGLAPPGWPPACLVMPFYPCSLADLLKQGAKFHVSQIIAWARHLALALAHLHTARQPVVHRDVKLSNVLFELADPRQRFEGPGSLDGATAVLTDLGTVGPLGHRSRWTVFRDDGKGTIDPHKDPLFYPLVKDGLVPEGQPCDPAMDLYAFGELLRGLARLTDEPAPWLGAVADLCQGPEPHARPRPADLVPRLSPDWDAQVKFVRETGNWRPEEHEGFEGRDYIIKDEFAAFVSRCRDRGGVFVVEGPAGVGKSALLSKWAERTGQAFGYYFRYRDNLTAPEDMPRALAAQLKKRFELDAPIPEQPDRLTAFLEGLCEQARQKMAGAEQLLLFVDGLDESLDAARAARFLPKKLPRGVYVITSSRPTAREKEDHVALLRAAEAAVFEMSPGDRRNQDDLRRFLGKQFPGEPAGALDQLAERCGGLFLLARLLVEAIRPPRPDAATLAQPLSIAQALEMSRGWADLDPSQRLFAYYQESWERLCLREDTEALGNLGCFLAAAQGWVEEGMIGDVLGWHERVVLGRPSRFWAHTRVRSVLRALTWFLSHRDSSEHPGRSRVYQLRHQSIRDFLLGETGPVSPRALQEMHQSVGQYFCAEAKRTGGWQYVAPYGRFFAARHFLQTNDREQVLAGCQLLTSPDYLQATLGDEPCDEPF